MVMEPQRKNSQFSNISNMSNYNESDGRVLGIQITFIVKKNRGNLMESTRVRIKGFCSMKKLKLSTLSETSKLRKQWRLWKRLFLSYLVKVILLRTSRLIFSSGLLKPVLLVLSRIKRSSNGLLSEIEINFFVSHGHSLSIL